MKKTIKRACAGVLAAVMALSLTACGGGGNGGGGSLENDTSGLQKVALEHVYVSTPLKYELAKDEYMNEIKVAGESVFLTTYYNLETKDAEGNTQYEYGNKIYSLDVDTGALTLIKDFPQAYTQNADGTSAESNYCSQLTPCEDGSIWYVAQTYHEDWSDPENYIWEGTNALVHAAADGTEVVRKDINDLGFGEDVYVNSLCTTDDGNLVIVVDSTVAALDSQCNVLFKINNGDNYIERFINLPDGDVVCVNNLYDKTTYESLTELVRVNFNTKQLETVGKIPLTNASQIAGCYDGKIYLYGTSAVYAWDINAGTTQEELNWLNSDVNSSRLNLVSVLSDGRVLLSEYSNDYSETTLSTLKKASDGEVTEKYVINLAAIWLTDSVRDGIIMFNRQNSEYRIVYKDYSEYNTDDNYSGGYEKLNQDMIAGNVPDLIMMDNLNVSSYISKGLLADIGKLMENDTSFDRSLYLENILNATSYEGGLYSIIPAFSIRTVLGKTENVGDKMGWTFDDLKALMERYPDAAVFSEMERGSVITYCAMLAMDQFVDLSAGTCNFDSDSFIQMLEFVNTFPEEIDWEALYGNGDDYWQAYESQFKDNKTLLQMSYLSNISDYKYSESQFGADTTFIGFPTSAGIGSSIIPADEIAVSANTKLPETCWEFLKYLLGEDYQSGLSYNFPVLKSSLDKNIEEQMSLKSDASGGSITMYGDDITDVPAYDDPWSTPLTQKQADKIQALVSSVTNVERDYQDLIDIITEEADAYFSGQKTAQEVAGIIQSRAQIFVSENS